MNILVTGGAGFIGSYLVDRLCAQGHNVVVYDNLDPQVHPEGEPPSYLNKEARFVRADVRDKDALRAALEHSEAVVHLAAAVGVGQSQYRISHYVEVNVGGTAGLLDIVANNKTSVGKIIVAASMSSYGEGAYDCPSCARVRPGLRDERRMRAMDWGNYCKVCGAVLAPVPTRETDERQPNSIYALTKMAQEEMVLNIGRTYGIPSVALRLFNVYGPRQSLSNPYTGVAALFMSRLKNYKAPVIFEDGLQTRDFVSVHDVVDAFTLALRDSSLDGGAFNVGCGSMVPIVSLAYTLARVMEVSVEPHITGSMRKGDVRHCYPDISRIKAAGFNPKISLDDGLKELVEWSRAARADDHSEKALEELREKGII